MPNSKNKCVGLIITDHSLAAVKVEMGKNGPSITNYSKILLEEGIVANGCVILNRESFKEAVQRLLKNGVGGPIKTHEILVSLPEEKIFSHELEVPRDKVNDLDYIQEAARDYIPIELSKAVFDFKTVHENKDNKNVTLNFAATQSNIIETIVKTLKEININVVQLNVDINCLIRSFDNKLNGATGDYLLVNLNIEQDLFVISQTGDGITKLVCKADKKNMVDKLKALFNLSTTEEVKDLLIALKKESNLSEEQKASLKNSFKDYIENLALKIKQVVTAAESKQPLELHTVYLTGVLSSLPGINELISALLPEIPIKSGIEYTKIPEEIETDALQGIGLCLSNTMTDDSSCFNLLPQHKKDEINLAKISPKLKIASSILTILLLALSAHIGLKAAGNYLEYKITTQEVAMYNEQAMNPYVTQIARIKQQQKQNEEQIRSLLNDTLPVSLIMSDLHRYNKNGVSLVNVNFNDAISMSTSDISIKAKTANRTETEEFINSLEETPLYSSVDSPLSNLVGKGERFVNVGLVVDKQSIIDAYNAEFEKLESGEETLASDEENDA